MLSGYIALSGNNFGKIGKRVLELCLGKVKRKGFCLEHARTGIFLACYVFLITCISLISIYSILCAIAYQVI